jgi:hypothetical protein
VKFILFVIFDKLDLATQKEMEDITTFNRELKANNHFVYAAGLANPDSSILIDNRENVNIVENKSLLENKEFYIGFWIIEAKDEIQAKDLALKASLSCNRKVELRQIL